MSNNQRVLNISRGYTLKHKQALRAVENCAAGWVVFGESIRDLSLAESIAKRNEHAKVRDPLPCVELPGLIYRPPNGNGAEYRREIKLAREATLIFSEVVNS